MSFVIIGIQISALALLQALGPDVAHQLALPAPAASSSPAPATPKPTARPPATPTPLKASPSPAPSVSAAPIPASSPGSSSPPSQAPAVAPSPERRAYLTSDGALHFPVDGRGQQPQLTCVPLFVCDISLEASENVLNLATGDSVRWLIASAQSGPAGATPHVLVKPTAPDLFTNLVVTTTRRVYYINLSSARVTPYSRLAFYYPDDEAAAAAAAASAERARDAAREAARAAEEPLRPSGPVDYAFRQWGDTALLPARVYADATHTFVEFARLPQDLPVVFAVTPDGSDQIINYRVKDTVFVVDGTPRDLELVLDAGTGRHGRGERRAHVRHL